MLNGKKKPRKFRLKDLITWNLILIVYTDTYNYTLISLDEASNVSVSIYPNPFKDQLYIALDGYNGEIDYVVKMYDARGRLVINKEMSSPVMIIDRKNLSSGEYYLHIIKRGDILFLEKIIITNK